MFPLRFKSLLASSGPDGSPNKEIEISDVKYNIFQVTNLLFISQFKNKTAKKVLILISQFYRFLGFEGGSACLSLK